MTVTRDGQTRIVQIARCLGECRTEVKTRMGKARTIPAQFEILVDDAVTPDEGVDENVFELADLLKSALSASGIRQAQAASQIGCSQSVISKILHGYPIADKTAEAAREWANRIISNGMVPQEPHEEPLSEAEELIPEMAAKSQEISPYETLIRRLLEEAAQKRLEELAGEAARDMVVRVHLEWTDRERK